jgi:hypothetical protein
MSQQYGWWIIGGNNLQARYAYGSESQADKYVDALNADREINLYSATLADAALSDDLDQRLDGFDLDDWEAIRSAE